MTRPAFAFLALFAAAWAPAAAQGFDPDAANASRSTAAFARTPFGVRAIALGGAVAAADPDATAIASNPAGLAGLDPAAEGFFQGGLLPNGEWDFQSAVAGWAAPQVAVGISLLVRDLGDVEVRRGNTLTPDAVWEPSAQVYSVAVGGRLFSALDVGLAVRYMRESVGGLSGEGIAADGGFVYRPWPRFAAGLVVRDFLASDFSWTETVADNLDGSLVLGASLDLNPVLVVAQADSVTGDDRRLSAGAEWDIHPSFTLRAGVRDGRFSAGFGVRRTISKWYGVRLDYALASNPMGGGSFDHRVGITLSWLDWRWKRGKLLLPTEEKTPQPPEPEWQRPSRRPPLLFTWPKL